jgi:hypothetical protein
VASTLSPRSRVPAEKRAVTAAAPQAGFPIPRCGDVGMAVAVEVGHDDGVDEAQPCVIAGGTHPVVRPRAESAVSRTQERRHAAVAVVRDRDIELVVVVQVGQRDGLGIGA